MIGSSAARGARPLASRADLTSFLMEQSAAAGADAYILCTVHQEEDRSDARILASNWVYDALDLTGHAPIARLALGACAAPPGFRARLIATAEAPEPDSGLTGEEAKLLAVLGHAEIAVLGIQAGRHRLHLLLSAATTGRIDPERLPQAQFLTCYALSRAQQLLAATQPADPLSDRERECLYWVSEGKTTDDAALILGVSSNTVNSYITHAIQKLGATNRVMAMATAIRNGII